MPPIIPASISAGLTITNPLVLYRALLAIKKIDPDPSQHRLAIELQKLYYRLKDYSPQAEYGARIKAIARVVHQPPAEEDDERQIAVLGHPLRRNPLFSRLFTRYHAKENLALTRVLTSHEEAMNLNSPKGFLLHGEVGTGKSLFLDLLADSLPNRKKRRWHFNTFMLEILAQLEQLRISRSLDGWKGDDSEHALLWLAKDLIEKSPILFLDEFQLPDRAASKILSNLFTTFFQLGGVLIASSNRMPDELAKASGVDYTTPSRGGLVRKLFGFGGQIEMNTMFPANNEYAGFVEVLKARCDIYDLSGRDWRRKEAEEVDAEAADIAEVLRQEMVEGLAGLEKVETGNEQKILDRIAGASKFSNRLEDLGESKATKTVVPKHYLLATSKEDSWKQAVEAALPSDVQSPIPWQSTTLLVYGRKFPVPRHLEGVSYWSFPNLCGGPYGPADYITLASTFHTLILDEVPVLTIFQKNEARRMITLLDALYEARCKLVIRAEAGPDDLYFPEANAPTIPTKIGEQIENENNGRDAVYPETLSEIYQDQISPFRPNVSIYTDKPNPKFGYDPDEDSDFGQVPGKGNEIGRTVDFGMTSSFIGEDEKFAYKRARSRLWELCSASWNARSELGWWSPLPIEVRRWERSSSSPPLPKTILSTKGDVKLGPFIELDKPAGLQGKELEEKEEGIESPFREKRNPPPKIGWTHAWGQGPDGLDQRKDRK